MQEHFNHLYNVMTLVYRLVFVHIGYDGIFTARTATGWLPATFMGTEVRAALKLD